jgi:hypothetical protein
LPAGQWPFDNSRMTTRKAAPAPADRPRTPQQQAVGLSPWLKAVLSALLVFHVTAVFWGPFAFACGGSPFADQVRLWLRPYIEAAYLDHGYFFFAPNPGPSHLVRYRVEFADGRQPLVGTFPDLKTQQPRLVYHRHFMLAEALHNRYVPPEPPPEPTPPPLTATSEERARHRIQSSDYKQTLANWRHQRRQYEAMWRSFEEHLKHEYGGAKVTLTRVEHRPAMPAEVQYERRRLDAADSYRDLPESNSAEPRQ